MQLLILRRLQVMERGLVLLFTTPTHELLFGCGAAVGLVVGQKAALLLTTALVVVVVAAAGSAK